MRISKLLGVLFLVGGLFVFTRGTGWHWGYMLLGSFLGFISLLLLSARRPNRFRVRPVVAGSVVSRRRARQLPSTTKQFSR